MPHVETCATLPGTTSTSAHVNPAWRPTRRYAASFGGWIRQGSRSTDHDAGERDDRLVARQP
jgi:hypothetical protein